MFRLKFLTSALSFLCLLFALAGVAHAKNVTVDVFKATETGPGDKLGTVTFADDADGLVITTDLKGLPAGERGFHIHEFPNCGPTTKDGKVTPAGAAGGHWDPDKTGKHAGPGGGGHKGDLPLLKVADDGTAKVTLQVKGLTTKDIKQHALMIHAGGDNFSDQPAALGGGGARFACGVIE